MFLKPCHSVTTILTCQRLDRLHSIAALRSLSAFSFAAAGDTSVERTVVGKHYVGHIHLYSQLCGRRPMSWAGSVTCNSNHALQHLNPLRGRLITTQSLVKYLAPYAGGVTALSAGTFQLQRQQTNKSKRRSNLSHGVAFVETATPVSMQQSGQASSSSSESDTDLQPTPGSSSPSEMTDK